MRFTRAGAHKLVEHPLCPLVSALHSGKAGWAMIMTIASHTMICQSFGRMLPGSVRPANLHNLDKSNIVQILKGSRSVDGAT